jgi:hypothetical protein
MAQHAAGCFAHAGPSSLPLELIINLKAAKQIGGTIPPNVLARADRVLK